jgi:hypothetical protein
LLIDQLRFTRSEFVRSLVGAGDEEAHRRLKLAPAVKPRALSISGKGLKASML